MPDWKRAIRSKALASTASMLSCIVALPGAVNQPAQVEGPPL
jgi:hypothetical protein